MEVGSSLLGSGICQRSSFGLAGLCLHDKGSPRIISIADVPNARSIAVMKRLGMTLDHTAELVHEGETFSAVIYAITRERWQSNMEPIAK